jgi:uncharacterized membrane protein YqjE
MAYQTTRLGGASSGPGYDATHSASHNTGSPGVGPIVGFTRGASSVLGDALDLAELQTQLLRDDAHRGLQKAKPALVGLVLAMGLLLAALPVLGSGLASLLAWGLEWPLWTTELLVGVLFVALGCFVAWRCVKAFRSALTSFSNTQREAAANIHWLRQTLTNTVPSDR